MTALHILAALALWLAAGFALAWALGRAIPRDGDS